MHVRGTGAVRLYIQLAPWRYSSNTFEVGVWIVSETNITTGFGSKSRTAQINIYYYSVGSFFEVCASPVPSRILVVLRYLISKPTVWTKLLISTTPQGTAPREKIKRSREVKEQKIYYVRHWSIYTHSTYNCCTSAICASAIKLNFSSNRRCCTRSSEMGIN